MITKIWEHLCIGGLKDAEQLNADNAVGIAAVILRCPEEPPLDF